MSDDATAFAFRLKDALLGLQFLFVAFGALVLVPILTGLNPNVALFTAGAGTLLFQLINREQVPPVFLASSFAFIAPIIHGVQTWGIAGTMSGLVAAGLLYVVLSLLISRFGAGFLHHALPPIVVGPVIISIGLVLAPVAVNMALGKTGDGAVQLVPTAQAGLVSAVALSTTLVVMLRGRGTLRLFSILAGIGAGYGLSLLLGLVDFTAIRTAPVLAVPDFVLPEFNWQAILFILPVAVAPAVEHMGDMLAISRTTGRDYLAKPGLKKTLLGDGLATALASTVGGPPNTTYSEVTGAVAITKAYNPAIMTWAALLAVTLSFCGKLGGILATIPVPVMGGILLLLFGSIAAIGMQTLIHAKVDLSQPRNLTVVAMILVFAIGGMTVQFGDVAFGGIGLGAVVGILLNLLLPRSKAG
ncbi:MAG: uracil-xanthine permease family protein [Synoicihabitans sp.]